MIERLPETLSLMMPNNETTAPIMIIVMASETSISISVKPVETWRRPETGPGGTGGSVHGDVRVRNGNPGGLPRGRLQDGDPFSLFQIAWACHISRLASGMRRPKLGLPKR